MSTEEMSQGYARQVGERLRNIRRQQGLSLQAVEAPSDREFKASVLGAYERGERVISVLRLQRLARFYAVPVDQLLPRDTSPMPSSPRPGGVRTAAAPLPAGSPGPVTDRPQPPRAARGAGEGSDQPLREHDPAAAGRLQRAGPHHPRRGRAGAGPLFERDAEAMRERMGELGIRF